MICLLYVFHLCFCSPFTLIAFLLCHTFLCALGCSVHGLAPSSVLMCIPGLHFVHVSCTSFFCRQMRRAFWDSACLSLHVCLVRQGSTAHSFTSVSFLCKKGGPHMLYRVAVQQLFTRLLQLKTTDRQEAASSKHVRQRQRQDTRMSTQIERVV